MPDDMEDETMTGSAGRSFYGVIPWLALLIVAIFAFSQVDKRGEAESSATRARDDLRALAAQHMGALEAQRMGAPQVAVKPVAGITARERALDEELSQAREALKKQGESLSTLTLAHTAALARADRLAALHATEAARAHALEARMVAVGEQIQEVADDGLAAARADLATAIATAVRSRAQLEEARAAHQRDVQSLTKRVAVLGSEKAEATARATELGVAVEKAQGAHQQELSRLGEQVEALLKRAEHNAALLKKLAVLERELRRERKRREVAELAETNAALHTSLRLTRVARLQLAAEDASNLVTGARLVGLLKLDGHSVRLLELTDHEDAGVRAAAARALAGAVDLPRVSAEAGQAWPLLLADEDLAVRLAGVQLAEALLGRKIAFEPAAAPKVRAAALARLVKKSGS